MRAAYNGRNERKAELVARLRHAVVSGKLRPLYAQANPEVGGLAFCLTGRGDPATLAEAVGIPLAFAALLEQLVFSLRQDDGDDEPGSWSMACLEAIPVGADLDPLCSWLACDLLRNPAVDAAIADTPALKASRERIASLHESEASHRSVDRAQWANARASALAATDATVEDMAKIAGGAIEAGAWPVSRAPECLAELNGTVGRLHMMQATLALGWTTQDDAAVIPMMERLWTQAKAEAPDTHPDVHALLMSSGAPLGERYLAQNAAALTALSRHYRAVGAQVLNRLKTGVLTT